VETEVREAISDFARTVAPAPDAAAVVGSTERAAVALGLRYTQLGVPAKEAGRRAVAELVDERYDYVGTARAPKGLGAKAEQWAAYVVSTLKADELDVPPPDAQTRNLTDQQRAQAYHRVLRRAIWSTNADGSGWVLLDENYQPVRRRDGTAVGFHFRDMGDLPAPASLEIVAP
jgi:hypothetical protein